MGTSTSRLGLFKPAVSDLMSDVNNHLNANLDKIDAAMPFTRAGADPGAPYVGQLTLRSDLSDKAQIRESAAWREWAQYYTPVSIETETNVTTTSTTYTAGADVLSTTFNAPHNGRVWVTVSALGFQSTNNDGFCGFEIRNTNAAGAVVVAAADNKAIECNGVNGFQGSFRVMVSGLTPLTQLYYIQTMIRSESGAATYTAGWRRLEVERRHCT